MIPAASSWNTAAASYLTGMGTVPVVLLTIGKTSLSDTGGYARILSSYKTGVANQYAWLRLEGAKLTQSVSDLDASSNLSNVTLTCTDGDLLHPQALTGDINGGYTFGGQTAILWVGWSTIAQTDFVQLATMILDHTDYGNDNTTLDFVIRDNTLLINNYAFITAQNGLATCDQNPATVMGRPFDPAQGLAVTALIDADLPTGLINAAAISYLDQNIYLDFNMLFAVTYPPSAKDWIETEVLKPLGCCWFWNYLGQWTPYSLLPAVPPVSVLTLDQTNIAAATLPVPVESEMYTSALTYRMDMDSNGQNAQTIFTDIYAPAANLYGISQTRVIISRGVRSSLGGLRMAHLMANMIFRRYGLKPLTLQVETFAPGILVEMGEKITINHHLIPNGKFPAPLRNAGTLLGVNGTLWEVTRKTIDLAKMTATFELLDVSWELAVYPDGTQTGAWYIAPDATKQFAAESAPNQRKYMYVCNSSDQYSTGAAAHTLW